jgi:hypothetical protein
VAGGRTTVPARQSFHHQDPVRHAGDDTTRGGGQRIQRKAIQWQITDKRGGWTTWVVDGIRRRQQTTEHGIGKEDGKGGQGQRVGVLEAAGCGWWRRGRSENMRQRRGGGDRNLYLKET